MQGSPALTRSMVRQVEDVPLPVSGGLSAAAPFLVRTTSGSPPRDHGYSDRRGDLAATPARAHCLDPDVQASGARERALALRDRREWRFGAPDRFRPRLPRL